jgi:K+-sensing histidine kinase KdpD
LDDDADIEITVARQRDLVRIDVHDNGSGFALPDGEPRRLADAVLRWFRR